MVQRLCSKNLVVCGACNTRLIHRVAGPFWRSQQAHSAFLHPIPMHLIPISPTTIPIPSPDHPKLAIFCAKFT